MVETRSVRVGIVGVGDRGRAHAEDVEELGHEVVAGVDVSAVARDRFASEFDASTYDDHEEMYAAETLDAVVVVTPNRFHESASVSAFEAGLDVFIEKPLAHTLDSAERIAEAAETADGFGMVGFNDRFTTVGALLESRIADGELGEITHVEANHVRRRGMPTPGTWFTSQELAGGGALVDIGGHALNYALAVMDFPEVREVFGTTRTLFDGSEDYADPDGWFRNWTAPDDGTFDVEDSATAFLLCEGGRTISLDVSWAMNRRSDHSYAVCGTDAGAEIRGDTLELLDASTEVDDHYVDTEIRKETDVWKETERAFLDAVATGDPPDRNTIEEGLAVQRVLDAIYRSAERGTSVRVA